MKILGNDNMDSWDQFVFSHTLGTIYHTSLWRKIIKDVYGHQPLYLVIEDNDGNITAGLPLFLIRSGIMGKRLSSLPCAQCCNPLVSSQQQYDQLIHFVLDLIRNKQIKYFELKTSEEFPFESERFGNCLNGYCTYQLGLDEPLDMILRSFHKSCVQRPIKKNHTSGIKLIIGDSMEDVEVFYSLYSKMRKNYGLLSQPYKFFTALWKTMAENKNIEIMHAQYDRRIISSLLLLKYKDTVIYEYGASLPDMMNLYPSHFLLWEAIKRSKEQGYKRFDFGRTSVENKGLSEFKSRWGATRQTFLYYYMPHVSGISMIRQKSLAKKFMHYTVKLLPDPICRLTSELLYKILV